MTTEEILRDLLAQGLSDEELARALLELTLQAAPPEVAEAVRLCALPAWFDADLLALLLQPSPTPYPLPLPNLGEGGGQGEGEGQPLPPDQKRLAELLERLLAQIGQSPQPTPERREAAATLIEQVAAFSFVLPREGGGYVYHESTRARLLDWWRLPQNRERYAALTDRLADHSITLAQEQVPRLQGPHYLAALAALDAAYPNIRAAWEGAAETKNWPRLRDLAYALPNYFRLRGRWADWIAWSRAGLDACTRLGDEAGAAAMQNNLGLAYAALPTVATGDRAANLQQAIACYREALRFLTPEAAPLAYAATQNNLGNAYLFLPTGDRAANLAAAIACYTAALQVEHLLPEDKALLHRNRADSLIRLGRLEEAEQDCAQARALAPDHPYTHARLGQLAFARAGYAAAVEHYTAALERQPEAAFYFDRGRAYLALGQPDQALADYQAGLATADALAIAGARQELEEFATEHPDIPGLDAVRALLAPHSPDNLSGVEASAGSAA